MIAINVGNQRCIEPDTFTQANPSADEVVVESGDLMGTQVVKCQKSLHCLFRDEFADLPEMLESGICLGVVVYTDGETHGFWGGNT